MYICCVVDTPSGKLMRGAELDHTDLHKLNPLLVIQKLAESEGPVHCFGTERDMFQFMEDNDVGGINLSSWGEIVKEVDAYV